MKILMITGASCSIVVFRKELIKSLINEGNDVYVIACDNDNTTIIENMDCKFFCVGGNNRDIGIKSNLQYVEKVKNIIKLINPDKIMTFQAKANTFGLIAAKKAGCNSMIAMVEGLGDVFINNTFKWKIIKFITCLLYKYSFRKCKAVFFINDDDKYLFLNKKLVKKEQCYVIHGVGVNIDYFIYKPIINHNIYLMVSRMLKTKGVIEYCEAAKIVKNKYPNTVFNYVGPEGTLKLGDIKQYIDDGIINYLGVTKDVRQYMEEASVIVLPSYREGFGLCIAEAASIGRPSIATNTVGCKDAIKDGVSGVLVDVKNVEQLANKMIWYIENPDQMDIMGNNARKYVEENFDRNKINNQILSILCSK